jgi:glycosyltransferase involved in cell wall biosynthesis
LRRFDRLIGVNQEIVDVFHRFGVSKDRTRFIFPHAIPVSEGDSALPESLEQFFRAHSPVFVSVGGMEPEYDVPLQMNAMPALRSLYPDCGLIAVGGGSREEELRALHSSVPDNQHIVLYGDLAHAKTLTLIRRADVFLRTTLYDGDAISVREALHYGTPVVATDNGLRPPGCILFPIGDRGGLVDAVVRAMEQGRSASQSVDDANIRAVVELYSELLG